ncbi:feruloyl-CoA synthase [Bergeriella denitrificans]|uniref:Long-chain-fatty-acid--CoA-ligase n=1 Tax=Bergeriella denitrificans TaxID=494 RepID=A0A378UJC6_BERDE|nr:feruloyl-CoA synthase [Bergeriella denitrificans]STZ76592.1 long-chain-fatty-acid--CoA-ligase [Bergeriella denitrificans]
MHAPSYLDYPIRPVRLGGHEVTVREAAGAFYITPQEALKPYPEVLSQRLYENAEKYPDRLFAARRGDGGEWVRYTYAETLAAARNIAQALLPYRLSAERPLMILSENSLEAFLLNFGAMLAGVPYAFVAPAYSLVAEQPDKLRHVIDTLTPGMFFAGEGTGFRRHLEACGQLGKPIITTTGDLEGHACLKFDDLLSVPATDEVEARHAQIRPDDIAKFLFTSGSTALPKVVPTTHKMLCSNQQMLRQTLAMMEDEPPVLVDWLSWHHTFGGSHNLGIALYNAGTFYIDDGRPVPGRFGETIRNLKEISPTMYLNVPVAWAQLANALQEDAGLRETFFKNVKLFFFAGAALSQDLWQKLSDISYAHCGERIRIMAGLGMTETSPSCTFTTGPSNLEAGFVGFPAPGCGVKLVPVDGKLELRVRGPHVMPGYWRHDNPRGSFDEEGFYCTGDAVRLLNPDNIEDGLVYDGRIAEDFKLVTGTFVNVGELRNRMLIQGNELIEDVVLAGEGRDEIGALVFPKPTVTRRMSGLGSDADWRDVLASAPVQAWFGAFMGRINQGYSASSKRIARLYLMAEPADVGLGETTDKGTLNQRLLRSRRSREIEALYGQEEDPFRFIAP